MENLLPFLLLAAGFIYKIYSNFQEEQKKAQKRNPSQPVAKEPEPAERPINRKEGPSPERRLPPVLNEEVFDPEHPYEPGYKPSYPREPVVERYRAEKKYEDISPEVVATKEYYNPERPAAEVVKSRKIHERHKHRFTPYVEIEERSEYANFDLRDAIIKSAILNRPWV